MVMVKDLTKLTLKDLWRGVKDEGDWWGEISERTLAMVKLILESSLEEELLEELQASRYRRSKLRRVYCNGHYERSLYIRFSWSPPAPQRFFHFSRCSRVAPSRKLPSFLSGR